MIRAANLAARNLPFSMKLCRVSLLWLKNDAHGSDGLGVSLRMEVRVEFIF